MASVPRKAALGRLAARYLSPAAAAATATAAARSGPEARPAAASASTQPPQPASHPRSLSSAGLARALSGPEVGRGRCQTGA